MSDLKGQLNKTDASTSKLYYLEASRERSNAQKFICEIVGLGLSLVLLAAIIWMSFKI